MIIWQVKYTHKKHILLGEIKWGVWEPFQSLWCKSFPEASPAPKCPNSRRTRGRKITARFSTADLTQPLWYLFRRYRGFVHVSLAVKNINCLTTISYVPLRQQLSALRLLSWNYTYLIILTQLTLVLSRHESDSVSCDICWLFLLGSLILHFTVLYCSCDK